MTADPSGPPQHPAWAEAVLGDLDGVEVRPAAEQVAVFVAADARLRQVLAGDDPTRG